MMAAEFESAYAARSGVTVDWLHAHGRYAEPCDCGEEMCEGWAMGHQWEDAIVEDALSRSIMQQHPEGCAFCPAELLGVERDRNGDPLCQTCPHLRPAAGGTLTREDSP